MNDQEQNLEQELENERSFASCGFNVIGFVVWLGAIPSTLRFGSEHQISDLITFSLLTGGMIFIVRSFNRLKAEDIMARPRTQKAVSCDTALPDTFKEK